MDLQTKIITASNNEEALKIIDEEITKINDATPLVEQLGFLDYGKSSSIYKGFIPLNTRIKYSNIALETYGMNSIDFFHDFALFIRKYNISNKSALIHSLETFINSYFGLISDVTRENIFNEKAWNSTETDDEYFEALKNNKISDLKGTGAAQCTERAAIAEQIISLFGTEVYYCIGCVDLGSRQEAHCFNIVKRKDDYALLDYSVPVTSYNAEGSVKMFLPFVGEISNEEFQSFTNNGTLKSFTNYEYIDGIGKEELDTSRTYVVGKFTIEKDDIVGLK